MDLIYLVIAQRVIRDETTKKYTIIDIFDEITIPKGLSEFPGIFTVYGKVRGIKAGETLAEVSIVHEDSSIVGKPVTLGPGMLKEGDLDILVIFNLVPISKAGKHFIKISINGVTLNDDNRFYFVVRKEN